MMQVIVNEETALATSEFITKRLNAITNQRRTGEMEDLALIIGEQLEPTEVYLWLILFRWKKPEVCP